jgi:hypothetical protein
MSKSGVESQGLQIIHLLGKVESLLLERWGQLTTIFAEVLEERQASFTTAVGATQHQLD